MTLWQDDSVQFPRLIAEILETQDLDIELLTESMDLKQSELNKLFDRAMERWERIKSSVFEEDEE